MGAAHLEDSTPSEALGRPSSMSSLPGELGRARARACSHMRESLAADGCPCPSTATGRSPRRGAPTSPGTPLTPRRASARSPTSHARSRSATTGAAPAYHERHSGGTADAGAFADLVSEAGLPGADCLAVADKGFASEGDFALLGELGLSYVVPPGRGNRFPGGRIPSGPAGRYDALAHDGRGAGCVTLPQEGLDVHAYPDTEPCHHGLSDARARRGGQRRQGGEARGGGETQAGGLGQARRRAARGPGARRRVAGPRRPPRDGHRRHTRRPVFWFNKNCAEIALIFEQRTHRFLRSIRIA